MTPPSLHVVSWKVDGLGPRLRHARRLDAARVDFALLARSRMGDVVDATIDEHLVATLGSDPAPIHLELGPDPRVEAVYP